MTFYKDERRQGFTDLRDGSAGGVIELLNNDDGTLTRRKHLHFRCDAFRIDDPIFVLVFSVSGINELSANIQEDFSWPVSCSTCGR